jgi:hypothetical protein
MPALIDEAPVAYLANLVYAVSKLETTILNVNGGSRVGRIFTIDIDNARHSFSLSLDVLDSGEVPPIAIS